MDDDKCPNCGAEREHVESESDQIVLFGSDLLKEGITLPEPPAKYVDCCTACYGGLLQDFVEHIRDKQRPPQQEAAE